MYITGRRKEIAAEKITQSSELNKSRRWIAVKKVVQLNRKTQLMERDALNQQRVTQRYASPYHIW